jgi:hypothetical protein
VQLSILLLCPEKNPIHNETGAGFQEISAETWAEMENTYTSIMSNIEASLEYGRSLVQSGLKGARSRGQTALAGASVSSVLLRSVRSSWAAAAVGAALGAAGVTLARRRRLASPLVLASGALGAAIGIATGVAWRTRHLTGEMARGARKSIDVVRDAHWLAKNPIDYA